MVISIEIDEYFLFIEIEINVPMDRYISQFRKKH